MRLAMILASPLPPREGIGFHAWNLAKQLLRRGHTVHLITRGRAAPLSRQVVDGIRIWKVPFFPLYPYHVQIHTLFVQALVHTLEPNLDLLHLHSPLVQLPRTKLPSLVTVHSPMKTATRRLRDHSFLSLLIRLQTPFSVQLEKDLFSRTSRLAAVTESVAQALSEYGIDPGRVAVMGNGVDTDLFRPPRSRVPNGPAYILTAGRLAPGKGLDDLIECARIVLASKPDVRFLVAGSGPLEKSLRIKIRELGLDHQIQLLGQVSDRNEMLRLYQQASVYFHPSHYEGLPTVVLEAMACARPVVATAVGGLRDLIQDSTNGLLVEAGNLPDLAGAVLRLLDDPGSLGEAARLTVQQRFSWETIATNYEVEYQALAARRTP